MGPSSWNGIFFFVRVVKRSQYFLHCQPRQEIHLDRCRFSLPEDIGMMRAAMRGGLTIRSDAPPSILGCSVGALASRSINSGDINPGYMMLLRAHLSPNAKGCRVFVIKFEDLHYAEMKLLSQSASMYDKSICW